MPKASDGEYELVLENKQVLTIFFVAVVLCAVFFGLGYVVGKNTVGYVPATEASSLPAEGKKSALDKAPASEKKEEAAQPAPDLTYQKALEDKPAPAKLEKPAEPAPAPAETAPVTPAPKPAVAAEPSAHPVAAAQTLISLQVAALSKKEDADALLSVLKKKNFPAFVNSSDGRLYRVQVGPFETAREAEDMKTRLEQEGFKAITKK